MVFLKFFYNYLKLKILYKHQNHQPSYQKIYQFKKLILPKSIIQLLIQQTIFFSKTLYNKTNIQKNKIQMIQQSLKIKINQFILAYERQCAQFEFEQQNIKQNVMLSIIQNRNKKKNNLQQSRLSSKTNHNLASSKDTKFSQDKKPEYQINNRQASNYEEQSQFIKSSKILQKSNVSMKSNKLNNNFILNQQENRQEDQSHQTYNPNAFAHNASTFGKSQLKNLQILVDQNSSKNINLDSSKLSKKSQQRKSPTASNNNERILSSKSRLLQKQVSQQNLKQSTISRKSNLNKSKLIQKQFQDQYAEFNQNKKSNMFIKNESLQYNQDTLGPGPSLVLNQDEQQQETYPTFQKPSFQFITNMQTLRQSDPNYGKNLQQHDYQQEQQPKQLNKKPGKWNSRDNIPPRNKYTQEQPQQQQQERYQQEQNQYYENQIQPNEIQNIQQNQSEMIVSQINHRRPQQKIQQISQRKNYAFQINMDKSNLPSNQSIQQLKKRKILQLEKKRQQRMENNSKKKQNASQISNTSKNQKPYSNVFVGGRNSYKRENDNRDSLNKSINQKKQDKNSKKLKSSVYRNEESSAFQQNKTVITKYGDQSKVNNRSTSPLNTIKTIHTDKRPPLNKNKRQQNIFAPESGTFQRQKSLHKITADPKIVPIDRKNSFQKKSNIKIMVNAITYVCLPGELNRRQRQRLIDTLQKYENQFFIFLFKQYSRKVIKGIYILQSNQQKLSKIFGQKAPSQIFPEQIHQFYRFDSGSRQFKKIDGCKSFSFSVHAVDLR